MNRDVKGRDVPAQQKGAEPQSAPSQQQKPQYIPEVINKPAQVVAPKQVPIVVQSVSSDGHTARSVIGASLATLGVVLACVVIAMAVSPSKYGRTIATVESVDNSEGDRATVRYTVGGSDHHANLHFSAPVVVKEEVEVAYLIDRPSVYRNVHIRRGTLLAYTIPAACISTLLGLAIIYT